MPITFPVTASFKGVVHYVAGNTAFASRARSVYRIEDSEQEWKLLLRLPGSPLWSFRRSTRWSRRLFRAGIHHIELFGEQIAIVADRAIYIYTVSGAGPIYEPARVVGSRPLNICAVGSTHLYYGEYRGNRERDPVHIWESSDAGQTWVPVYQFENVRHVHGVFYDPYTTALWVTTGDNDSECGIWCTTDGFRTLDQRLGGSQQVRAVHLVFTEAYVYFGSDTPLEPNALYRMCRRTGQVEFLQAVESSVFYGCKRGSKLFFSTVCEPSEVNTTDRVVVWGSPDGEQWQRIRIFPKDSLAMPLFQYGQVRFPKGKGDPHRLWLAPFAVHPDQQSFELDISQLC